MALNTPYKRINPNEFNYAAVGQKDPWFALGYALGEGYWNRYNQRGIKKGIEEGEKLLENGLPERQPAPQELVDKAMTISVGKTKVSSEDVEKASSGATDKTIKPEVDHGLMKWDYVQDKYKDNPNPVGDRISTANIATKADVALDNPNVAAMDWGQFSSGLKKELILSGKNDFQINAVLEHIKPMFDAKKQTYNNDKVSQIVNSYIQATQAGDYNKAEQFGIEAFKDNPTIAQYLLSNNVGVKDRWKADNAERLALIKAKGDSDKAAAELTTAGVNAAKAILNDPNSGPEDIKAARDYLAFGLANKTKTPAKQEPTNLDKFGAKYSDIKKNDYSKFIETMRNDTELRDWIENASPEELAEFEQKVGISLPKK